MKNVYPENIEANKRLDEANRLKELRLKKREELFNLLDRLLSSKYLYVFALILGLYLGIIISNSIF